jgi:hypothetical protein
MHEVVERIEEAIRPSVSDLTFKTRADVAHTSHARAYDRVDRLAVDLRTAFEELWRAEAELKSMGIEVNVTLPFPIREAWFDWRAKKTLKP